MRVDLGSQVDGTELIVLVSFSCLEVREIRIGTAISTRLDGLPASGTVGKAPSIYVEQAISLVLTCPWNIRG